MSLAELLSQGDELLTGQTVDTNAAWLSERLIDMGFDVSQHTTVGDRRQQLTDTFSRLCGADLVVCTGGLGPTEDDLTTGCLADAYDLSLSFDAVAMTAIQNYFQRLGLEAPAINRKLAMLPDSCVRFDNHWGTAPGYAVNCRGTWFVCMPGVPREMKPMFETSVVPFLRAHFALKPKHLIMFRTIGMSESSLQTKLNDLDTGEIQLSFRTKRPENQIKLRVPADLDNSERERLVRGIQERIGDTVFAIEGWGSREQGGPLEHAVARALSEEGATVTVAESCTGGRVASALTSVPGASSWFVGGVIAYSNDVKIRSLGVRPETLAEHGAVSERVAREMAEGVRVAQHSTYGLAVTGIAGPGGGSDTKPVGTVHIAVASPETTVHRLLQLRGTREHIQSLSAAGVLELLRRQLNPVIQWENT